MFHSFGSRRKVLKYYKIDFGDGWWSRERFALVCVKLDETQTRISLILLALLQLSTMAKYKSEIHGDDD